MKNELLIYSTIFVSDNAPKYFSTKSPIDNQNETETSSESSNLPVNVADKQMSDAST